MNLIFLSERNLAVLDHGHASDDFEIILDALVPQKSKFIVNKQSQLNTYDVNDFS